MWWSKTVFPEIIKVGNTRCLEVSLKQTVVGKVLIAQNGRYCAKQGIYTLIKLVQSLNTLSYIMYLKMIKYDYEWIKPFFLYLKLRNSQFVWKLALIWRKHFTIDIFCLTNLHKHWFFGKWINFGSYLNKYCPFWCDRILH